MAGLALYSISMLVTSGKQLAVSGLRMWAGQFGELSTSPHKREYAHMSGMLCTTSSAGALVNLMHHIL